MPPGRDLGLLVGIMGLLGLSCPALVEPLELLGLSWPEVLEPLGPLGLLLCPGILETLGLLGLSWCFRPLGLLGLLGCGRQGGGRGPQHTHHQWHQAGERVAVSQLHA